MDLIASKDSVFVGFPETANHGDQMIFRLGMAAYGMQSSVEMRTLDLSLKHNQESKNKYTGRHKARRISIKGLVRNFIKERMGSNLIFSVYFCVYFIKCLNIVRKKCEWNKSSVDKVIFFGGKTVTLATLARIYAIWIFFRSSIEFYGIGFSSDIDKNTVASFLVRFILSKASIVVLREQVDAVQRLGLPVKGDLVYKCRENLCLFSYLNSDEERQRQLVISVNIMRLDSLEVSDNVEAYKLLICRLRSFGAVVKVFHTGEDDDRFVLREVCSGTGGIASPFVCADPANGEISFPQSSLVMASRMHAGLFALCHKLPVVFLGWDCKIFRVLRGISSDENFNRGDAVLTYEQFFNPDRRELFSRALDVLN